MIWALLMESCVGEGGKEGRKCCYAAVASRSAKNIGGIQSARVKALVFKIFLEISKIQAE